MDDLVRAIGDAGRRSSDPMLSPNQESPAVGQAGPTPSAGGSIHDTSSSSAEILHYPDDASPGAVKAVEAREVKAEEAHQVTETNNGGSLGLPPDKDLLAENEGEQASPSQTPVNERSGEDFPNSCDSRSEMATTAQMETSYADALKGDGSPRTPTAQSLMPSSSSVFSGLEEVNDANIAGEPMLTCGNDNTGPAQLAVVGTTRATPVVGTDSTHTDSSNPIHALSAPCSSNSLVSGSAEDPIPDHAHLNGSLDPPGQARLNKNCASQSSQVGKDITLTIPLPSSSSPSLLSPSLQNGSSLLSERLASNNESTVHKLDRTNGRVLPASSLQNGGVDITTQHSRREGDDVDLAAKLKAGALILDSSRKTNGVFPTAGSVVGVLANGKSISPSKPVYQNGTSTANSSPALKHVHRPHQHILNGAGEDSAPPQALSESTDTLVEQPLAVDIKHSNGVGSAKRLSNGAASYASSSSVSPSSSYSSPSLMIASPQRRELSSTPDSPQYIQSRRRAASGASRDLSVSPCNTCKGAWADAGRLRNPSGGGEIATRSRWIGATVATSTSDISDSFVGTVSHLCNEIC